VKYFVALDASPRAASVLAAAVQLARVTGAKLTLYRAVGIPVDLPRTALAATDARLEDMLIANARADLERIAAAMEPALVEAVVATFAAPWDGICREAADRDVDLIVIGAHGYGRLDRMIGTTVAKVANHADRNLLIVRSRRSE
jgi:universal stress protein F